MPANATGIRVGYVARKYESAPARLGHLYNVGKRGHPAYPHAFMPYALDNGAFGCFQRGRPFDVEAWRELLVWARDSGQAPMWCLVPDVVGDKDGTFRAWDRFAREASRYGWSLAFAAQDGMTPADVPADAAVIFMGGAPKPKWRDEWKWNNLTEWSAAFPGRLHVGRVNGLVQLRVCAKAGVASCDGTGFSRAIRQWLELEAFLAEMAGESPADPQTSLSYAHSGDETAA